MVVNFPIIVLVRPQIGENIGAAARAMLNFGLANLRLVSPRDGWPNQAAIDTSSGALDIMPDIRVFETLAESLADCHHVYATTNRRRDMIKPVSAPEKAVLQALDRSRNNQKTAFVFGPERTGLENDDLALCHEIITVDTNPDFPSINLSQAVLLITYEWHKTRNRTPETMLDMGDSFPATHEKLDEFLMRMEQELETAHFFRDEDLKPTMIRNIRNIFMRGGLSDQEVRTLHGIISALSGRKSPLQ